MKLEDFYKLPLRPSAMRQVVKIARGYKRNVGGPLSMCIQEAQRLPMFKLAERRDPKTGEYVSPLSVAKLGEILSS